MDRQDLAILGIIILVAVMALAISFLYNISKTRESAQKILELLEKNLKKEDFTKTNTDLPNKFPFLPSGKK
jgi:hypothetical protein